MKSEDSLREKKMAAKTLNFEKREILTKTENKRLRRNGKIPAVIYGQSKNEPKSIFIDAKEFSINFKHFSESELINLASASSKELHSVLVKDFQEDLIKDRIVHIDFYEVDKNKVLRAKVAIHLTGTPEGVKLGGMLETLFHEIEIECLPKDLPHGITVAVDALQIGDSIRVGDLPAHDGIKILTSSKQAICTVIKKTSIVEEAPAAATEGAAETATKEKEGE
jgi:large subunit ribosomal protein L25